MESKVWLNNYPSGVPVNIDANKYETLLQFSKEAMENYKALPAFENFGKRITYGEVDKQSDLLGAYLQSRGLEPGDKIALMMPNLLQYPIALFAAIKAGLVIVNTNPLYTPREMEHQFTDSDVKAIIIAENFASNLEKVLPKTKIKTIIKTSVGEMLGMKGKLINFVIKNVKKGVPKYKLPNTVSFKEALAQGKKFNLEPFEDGPDRVIVHQYTGGTTGVAKGAMLTNKNLVANMLQMKAWMADSFKEKEEIALCPLPLYHIFAFSVNCLAMMSFGSMSVLVTNPRDIKSLVKEFTKNDITMLTGVNTLFNALLQNDSFQALDFSKLKAAMGGGTAVQTPVAEAWEKLTNVKLVEGYGMTEASPVITANPFDGRARKGSIGMPIPSTDVRILTDDGTIGKVGDVGEIQCKGPQVMAGYYNRPDATAETIVDGWLCTGDIGLMMDDGYFKIVDRKKDMILVSGFNVYPNEIEDVIAGMDQVAEVAVIGVPHEKSGECVKAFIIKKDKSLNEKTVIDYCRENMTGYKVPKMIEFRTELPKSNVGKILRKDLRAEEAAKG